MTDIKVLPEDEERLPAILSSVYNLSEKNYKIGKQSGITTVSIDDKDRRYESKILINIDDNAMEAKISIYPSIGINRKYTIEEINEAITEEGVKANLKADSIQKAYELHEGNFIVDNIPIAVGVPPHQGKDAAIMLQFSPVDKKPKIKPDGKVDYKNIDNIIHAKKGDVLITKRPASLGIKGVTVKNGEIVPTPGKDIEITCGEGVMLNLAGTSYIATCDGYVDFSENTISVYQVYHVNKDVDFSTGNITFNGTVHIKGDVVSGFRVEASKDIIVEGICGDSEVIAHKNLIIKTGIKGNVNNLFKAGENIVVGYCEKGNLYAKKDIIIKKYAYNCELFSGSTITASNKEGIIAGGIVKAFSEVIANQLGTEGNTRFTVYLGTKYYIDHALDSIRKQKVQIMESLGKINDLFTKFNLNKNEFMGNIKVSKLLDLKKGFEKTIKEMNEKEEELSADSKAHRPKLKVKGAVFEGVTVMFFNCASTVREHIENVVFFLDEKYAEVSWVSLKDARNFELE